MKLPPRSKEVEPHPEGLFRFQVVSQVLVRQATGLSRAEAVRGAAAQVFPAPDQTLRQVSARTIYRWLAAFEHGDYPALVPAARKQTDTSLVLPRRLCDFLRREKKDDPRASVPELILRARVRGIVTPDTPIDRVTVWRACKRMGLPMGKRKRLRDRDCRRYAFPHRLDMVLADGKHFRAGVTHKKRVALCFLDDATRMGLHAVVGTAESAALFLRGLYEVIRNHGLSSGLYLDHGPGFIAHDTLDVVRQLGVLLVHGQTAYPEGHGKIERFNRSAWNDVLRGLDGRPDVDPACAALELRLQHYLRSLYNHRPHESLGKRTPAQRFAADEKPLRFPDSDAELRSRFVLHVRRGVSADHVASFQGTGYELPRGHGGTKVVLQRHLLDDAIRFIHQGKLITLQPVDPVQNARDRRAGARKDPEAEDTAVPSKSAADLLFDQDLHPAVTEAGDCISPACRDTKET